MKQYRHGDILLQEVKQKDDSAKSTADKLLAEGEGQNHGHYIEGDAQVYRKPGNEFPEQYIEVTGDAKMRHLLIDSGVWTGEHHDIEVAPGTYKVVRQREYDPFAKTIRTIND